MWLYTYIEVNVVSEMAYMYFAVERDGIDNIINDWQKGIKYMEILAALEIRCKILVLTLDPL